MPFVRRLTLCSLILWGALALPGEPAGAFWSELRNDDGRVIYLACKTSEVGGYGRVWKITLVMATTPDWRGSATFTVRRPTGKLVNRVTVSAQNGAWDVRTIYASAEFKDTWESTIGTGQISTGFGSGGSIGGPRSMNEIAPC
jgi:hypothetical protein